MAKRTLITFTIIVTLLAGFIRFWRLTSIPASLTMDEVSIGYAAYSLLQHGTDEWGHSWPLSFQSVGDYKPPVNIYLNLLSIAIFGLTEFAVRAPVALLGTLTIPLFVWLLYQLKYKPVAIIAAGCWLALLPWHLHFSRFGLEAVTALFLFLIGFNTYLKALSTRNPLWLTLAALGFSLSVWAYHSTRLFTPLFSLGLIILTYKDLLPLLKQKSSYLALITLMIFAIPFLYLAFTSPAIAKRAQMTSLLAQPHINDQIKLYQNEPLVPRLYHISRLVFHNWAQKYLEYFELRFIFSNGISWTPRDYPGVGLLYVIDLIPILMGIYAFLKHKFTLRSKLLLLWLLLGPLPASLTINDQHPLRALIWIPAFGMLFALGIQQLLTISKTYQRLLTVIYSFALILNLLYAYDIYTLHFGQYQSEYYGYGFKQSALYACEHQHNYDHIVFSPIYGSLGPLFVGLPDYYVLFYCQINPDDYLPNRIVPKYSFNKVDWRAAQGLPGRTLLISARWDYPEVTPPAEHILKRIDYLDGKPAFYILDTQATASP